jgi:hypothetical protein
MQITSFGRVEQVNKIISVERFILIKYFKKGGTSH